MANLPPRRMPIWQHLGLPGSYAFRVPLSLRHSAVLCVAAAAILLLSGADFHRVPDGTCFCWFTNLIPVFRFSSLRPWPLIMRSDSELLIFTFRSEKRIGLLMLSDYGKSDWIKSALRIRWPKSSDFGPKSDGSTHRTIKSKNGIGLRSSKNLVSRAGLVQQQWCTLKYEFEYSDQSVGL